MVTEIFKVLNGNLVTGFLNLVGLCSAGKSFTEIVGKITKEKQGNDVFYNMLWAAFFHAAYETITEKAANCLDFIKLCLNQSDIESDIKGELDDLFFEQYFALPLHKQTEGIYQCYKKLFTDICNTIMERNLLPAEHLDSIFQNEDLERNACNKWDFLLVKMEKDNQDFRIWIDNLRQQNLSEQMANLYVPSVFGADKHLLKREVKGEYWTQNIKIGNHFIPARPDALSAGKHEKWWIDLKNYLSDHVLILIGPGGMGKSAFLAYLYRTVERGWIGNPFGGAFLISLDTLISNYKQALNPDGLPLSDPIRSILLCHMASRSGDANSSKAWNNILSKGTRQTLNKPILLLLDGLNEVQDKKTYRTDTYNQIVSEISALADKSKYPNVCLVITSRIEVKSEISECQIKKQVENQLSELNFTKETKWQTAVLEGISEPLLFDVPIGEEMKALLQRPMYYTHFKERAMDKDSKPPTTQYEALSIMYGALSEQSRHNTDDDQAQKIRECIWKICLPVLAYYQWAGTEDAEHLCEKSATELTEKCSLQLIKSQFELSDPFYEKALALARRASSYAYEFLRYQEQLLIYDEEKKTYIFSHQDYRDYLVAEYFLQRLKFVGRHFRNCLPTSAEGNAGWINNLRLNTYGKGILQLIYQALSFEKNGTNSTKYVEYFSIHRSLDVLDITPASIIWFTAAYQLSDMCGLVNVKYPEASLYKDTLTVLEPLVSYACYETQNYQDPVLPQLNSLLKFHLIEILMKSCELYRRLGDFQKAIEITRAARYICGQQTDPMISVIDFNIAKVHLYDLMENGRTDNLLDALNTLHRCAFWTDGIPPHRFSCTTLGMIIVSPHPKLDDCTEYHNFLEKISHQRHPLVTAFWAYYNAIFDARKKGEGWLPRLYAMRQFLMLLAENKVQVKGHDGLNLNSLNIYNLTKEPQKSKISVSIPESLSPIPSKGNLCVIRRFLEEAEEFDRPWKYYLNGLIFYILDGRKDDSYQQFKKAAERSNGNDFKSRLWLAYLSGDTTKLEKVYGEGCQKMENSNLKVEITSYHASRYYERDVGRLFEALKNQM